MKRRPTDIEKSWVYLSYAAVDASFALKLAYSLLCAGVPLWIDRLNASAERWTDDLKRNLDRAALVIAIISPEYVQSSYALHEIRAAAKRKTPIIPALASQIANNQWLSELQPTALVDFTQWHDERAYRQHTNELLEALHEKLEFQNPPSVEYCYLQALNTRLEAHKSGTQYVDLTAELRPKDQDVRPPLRLNAIWGMNSPLYLVDHETHQRTPVDSLAAALAKHSHFILVGAPGSGKTTALERYAQDAVRSRLLIGRASPLPILIDLATWDDSQSIETFIQSRTVFNGETLIALTPWEVVLLLDNLDQMGEKGAEKAAELARWLRTDSAPRQVIIACREGDSVLPAIIPQVQIGELTEPYIRRYVETCLDESAADALVAQIFPRKVEDQARAVFLFALVRNFALLAALVFLYKTSPPSELPLNPGALLKRYFANYWIWKRHSNMPGWTPYKEMESGLHRIASAVLTGTNCHCMSYQDALALMGDERFLVAALTAGLLENTDTCVRFRDRASLDYFAAVGLLLPDLHTRLRAASFDENGARLFQPWDGVVILHSGMLASPDSLVRSVAEIDPYLAARCVSSGVRVMDPLLDQIVHALTELAFDRDNRGRVEAGRLLRVLARADGIDALLEIMRGGEWQERHAALQVLRQGESAFPPELLDRLSEWDWTPDENAAAALTEIGADAVPMMLNLLLDDDPAQRRGAAWALGMIDDCAGVPGLVAALTDSDMMVRMEAAASLGKIADPTARPFLQRALHDDNWEIREAVADAIEKLGIPVSGTPTNDNLPSASAPVTPPQVSAADIVRLLAALNHDNWQVRRSAVEGLAQSNNPSVVPALLEALHDEDAHVRHAAVKALELHPDDAVVEALVGAFRDSDYLVSDTAASVVSRIGKPAVPALLTLLQDENVDVKGLAVETLAQIGDHSAAAYLAELLGDEARPRGETRSIGEMAAAALQRLTRGAQPPPGTPPLPPEQLPEQWEGLDQLLNALYQPDWHARREAARVLREHAKSLRGKANARVLEMLGEALNHSDYVVRWAVVEALAWIRSDDSVPQLIRLLGDSSWTVRIATIRALVEIGDRAAIPALIGVLDDEHPMVRETAAEALGRQHDETALAPLIRLLRDPEPFVRRAAATGIGVIRDAGEGGVAALISVLEDRDPQVRWAAVEALGRLRDPSAVEALIKRLEDTFVPMWETRRICDAVAEALIAIGSEQGIRAVELWRLGQLV